MPGTSVNNSGSTEISSKNEYPFFVSNRIPILGSYFYPKHHEHFCQLTLLFPELASTHIELPQILIAPIKYCNATTPRVQMTAIAAAPGTIHCI